MSINSLALLAVLLPTQPAPPNFYYDFRGGKPLPAELKLFGPDAETVVMPESEGLRITLPTAGRQTRGWGIALRYTFTGDFEVTASYELLTLDRPTKGVGAGVALNALPTQASSKFTKIGRFVHADGENLFKAELTDKEQPAINQWNAIPASTRAGQLRLARTGSVMHYQVTDAPGGKFREVAAWEYGTEDLSMVRFIANNNGSPTAVDVRLLDLKVVGSFIPHQTLGPQDGIWLAFLVGVPVAILLIAAGKRWAVARKLRAE
jgi:Protein of unknown function (DUF1583)